MINMGQLHCMANYKSLKVYNIIVINDIYYDFYDANVICNIAKLDGYNHLNFANYL